MTAASVLPPALNRWFADRGWRLHEHQIAMMAEDAGGRSALLISPTVVGKTLEGFLPSLDELQAAPTDGLHTLYISPLKALAVDVHRNLLDPIAGAGLAISCETRTGDTPAAKRKRQRAEPPQILMTTPESLALLLSYPDAPRFFGGLQRVVVDELHALAGVKRGDLLALGLTRLASLAPDHRRVGLSATVADEGSLIAWLSKFGRSDDPNVALVRGRAAAAARVEILETEARLPWSGHMATHALEEVYARVKNAGVSIVFVNTRAQAEIVFQALWRMNDENLPIALHHGSLAREQRRKVEAAMAAGALRAVVATSSLDLGIDWAAVDLVIQIGAPKGASRLIQRIGRSNHRLDAPSEALVVPANRFEVLECQAAIAAIEAGELDGETKRTGGLDVLAQHLMGRACSSAFDAAETFAEVRRAAPYAALARADFDDVLGFVENGGYALRAYDRHTRIQQGDDGLWRVADRAAGQAYRMNVGTIVEAETLKVKLRGGRYLGEVEEWFVQGLTPGDTFIFSGQVLRYERIKDLTLEATRA
ncbi:MAG: DEAD/DEAH box helicase, partial [Pseudomonadota bacterium]